MIGVPQNIRSIFLARSSQRFDATFFRDTDDWNFDVTYVNAKGDLATQPEGLLATLNNGGFKIGLGYQWMWDYYPQALR